MARPRAWLDEHGLHDGTAWLALPEVGVAGWARVTKVGPAPREASGEGCLVLMTVDHVESEVLKLRFETGTEVEVTPSHPLFVDGAGWVTAGELKAGMKLRGDHGTVRLSVVEPARPNQRVFNIEVGLEHTYRVSADAIWAHNSCPWWKGKPGSAANRGYLDRTVRTPVFHNRGGAGFPTVKDLQAYSVDELLSLRTELVESVGGRIYENIIHGFESGHGERQAVEQALIRSIDKLLK